MDFLSVRSNILDESGFDGQSVLTGSITMWQKVF